MSMGSRPSDLSNAVQTRPLGVESLQDGSTPPNITPQHPLALQALDDSSENAYATAVGSGFLNDSKPPWGWDFILSFKLPKTLRVKLSGSPAAEGLQGNENHCIDILDDDPDNEDDDSSGTDDNNDSSHSGSPDTGWCAPPWRRRDQRGIANDEQSPHRERRNNRYSCQTRKRVEILARLKSAGFVFSQLVVPSENAIFVRLSLPERQLKQKAVHIGLELRLKEEYGSGFLSYEIEREYAYMNNLHKTQWNCFFSPSERAVIILAVLQSKEHWGCDLNLERLVYDQTILQAFALHSGPDRKRLLKRAVWTRWWDPTWKPPLAELKDYLGGRFFFFFFFE